MLDIECDTNYDIKLSHMHVPPPPQQIIAAPPPGAPPQKNYAYIFFNLPISRVCEYFAPHKYHAYAFLKYALKCLFLPIHIERNSIFMM